MYRTQGYLLGTRVLLSQIDMFLFSLVEIERKSNSSLGQYLQKIGLLFIPTSGHNASCYVLCVPLNCPCKLELLSLAT